MAVDSGLVDRSAVGTLLSSWMVIVFVVVGRKRQVCQHDTGHCN